MSTLLPSDLLRADRLFDIRLCKYISHWTENNSMYLKKNPDNIEIDKTEDILED